ncbi:unnamed protein product (macronuclear) [Paramecium tetraurelia]|uniref:Uncharacterized protein n=1 Tax=Paramecium tetraurelia TaxID=5888 RepID=A0CBT4_PARTE|nr:uncharacterized protein GSPATT00037034001 [Paramecium tetraurelia]CAK68251.1 unnamed protein product [Paramecium tetraurelia]|eukprot:XP_001435648.1 hypothetical protein (macronuclear) [Paramecium tetraurelia strain d4-2]
MKLNYLLLGLFMSLIETIGNFKDMSKENQKIQLQMSNKQHQIKRVKKIIDDQEQWFEEFFEYYEEVIYEYDEQDPDELSLGSQMDLEHLIENYDIPEDCYEENVSIYEYYDASEETQKVDTNKKPNQKTENENNFQVFNLGEEEFITLVDDHQEILDEDILTMKKPIENEGHQKHSKKESHHNKKSSNKKKIKIKNKKKNVKKQKKKQK